MGKLLAHPIFQLVLALVAILSFLFSIYTWQESRPSRSLAYQVEIIDLRDFIASTSRLRNFPGFEIRLSDTSIGESDRFVTIFTLYNNSNQEIERRHVLNDLYFRIPNLHRVFGSQQIDPSFKIDVEKTDHNTIKLSFIDNWLPRAGIRIATLSSRIYTENKVFAGSIRNVTTIDSIKMDIKTFVYLRVETFFVIMFIFVAACTLVFFVVKFVPRKLLIVYNIIDGFEKFKDFLSMLAVIGLSVIMLSFFALFAAAMFIFERV